ncbi:hypothetical protein OROMI_011258 [Orobanche minor]
MMVAIMSGEKVNWCLFVLKRLQEEAYKRASQKKSFGLILKCILKECGVRQSQSAKKVGPDKFISGCKPTAYNKDRLINPRPLVQTMPILEDPKEMSTSYKTC